MWGHLPAIFAQGEVVVGGGGSDGGDHVGGVLGEGCVRSVLECTLCVPCASSGGLCNFLLGGETTETD